MRRLNAILSLIIQISLVAALPMIALGDDIGYNFGTVDPISDLSDIEKIINIKSYTFQPGELTVIVGTTVTWSNQDSVQHIVKSDMNEFSSDTINPGKEFSYKFNAPGTYSYHCGIQPGMRGTIKVIESANQDTLASWSRSEIDVSGRWKEEPIEEKTIKVEGPDRAPSAASSLDATEGDEQQQYSRDYSGQYNRESINVPSNQVKGGDLREAVTEDFSQYYRFAAGTIDQQHSMASSIEIEGEEPKMLYFGASRKALPYSQYKNYALSTGANSLWIRGDYSWTQYAVVPQGSALTLIATSPSGGLGYIYEVYPDGSLEKRGYHFYPHNQIEFYADERGEHQIFFNIDGQPSNLIVIDVAAYQPPIEPDYSYALVTVSSPWLRGYDVYIDGIYQATEGMSMDPEGRVTIGLEGNRYHKIAILASNFDFLDRKYFNAGYAYTLEV